MDIHRRPSKSIEIPLKCMEIKSSSGKSSQCKSMEAEGNTPTSMGVYGNSSESMEILRNHPKVNL